MNSAGAGGVGGDIQVLKCNLFLLLLIKGISNCFLRTSIDAGTAEDAFGLFHPVLLHHGFYRQAHGTLFAASVAMAAFFRIGRKPQGGPVKDIPDFPTQDHKGSHPADMMAEGPLAHDKGRNNYQKEHNQVGNKSRDVADRKTVMGLIKEINLPVPTCLNGRYYDDAYPGDPDEPFNQVSLEYFFISGKKDGFLAAGARTDPPAEPSPQNKGADKQQ